ncbi:hypothetical protein FGG78_27500 [Thioclava sp. BHET1]|nr:hypothetical protein FGG78_27500 [Thioclava sp. BHET1]
MLAASPGRWDRGAALRVKIYGGALESAEAARVLGGANLVAIGDGSADRWELLQYCRADLVGENLYDLSLRLRGQAGTEGVMPELWPAGSLLVALDGAVE